MKTAYRTLSLGVCLALVCGCHTFGGNNSPGSLRKGETDTTAIERVVETWKTTTTNQDLSKLMRLYSDSFKHLEWGDKAGFESFLSDGIEMGYLDNTVVNITDAKVTLNDSEAEVYPIHLNARFGAVVIGLKLAKEPKGWMIVGMDMEKAEDTGSL